MQDTSDQLNWSLGQGSTSSSGTGPKLDHTLKNGKKNFFVIIDSQMFFHGRFCNYFVFLELRCHVNEENLLQTFFKNILNYRCK